MAKSNFPDRVARLDELLLQADQKLRLPLFREVGIPPDLFSNLRRKCNEYLVKSIFHSTGKLLAADDDLVDTHEAEIMSLPNMTPNGLILPKVEILDEYNSLHRTCVEIFDTFKLNGHVASIHAPINVRVISGKKSNKDSRPRASSKLHSDIWAGEFSNTTMLFFSALGDIENNGVEFLEPTEEFLGFRKPLNDYLDGASLEADSTRYECGMRTGFAYFTDPFLLHRTIKKTPRIRLSIDFRFIPHISCPTDIEVSTERHKNYVSIEEWREIGTSKVLYTEAMMRDSHADSSASRMNAYAADFLIKDK